MELEDDDTAACGCNGGGLCRQMSVSPGPWVVAIEFGLHKLMPGGSDIFRINYMTSEARNQRNDRNKSQKIAGAVVMT